MEKKPYSAAGDRLWQWRNDALKQARQHDVPPEEVDWLLQECAGLDRLSLRLMTNRSQAEVSLRCSVETLHELWQKRLGDRTPIQYLAGTTPWRTFEMRVSPAVLIPRPETELIIDIAVAQTRHNPSLRQGHWVDLGTGSGAIALGLAQAFPEATIHAVDCSHEALAIAQYNAQQNGLGDRIRFYQGEWFDPLPQLKHQISGVVSNPPYIPSADLPNLQVEVFRHEPLLALDGGSDGLSSVRYLVESSPIYLTAGGIWLVELMAGQAQTVQHLLQQEGYGAIATHSDLAGIERFVSAQAPLKEAECGS
ncbi:MAG: peptide chain release factor N(5)-glutamine methyltransferase [Elainellaceae cyanobacterium]